MSVHEVYSVASESVSLNFSNGELKTKEADSSNGFGVRVLADGRLGFAYCQKEEDLEKTKDNARRMSRFSVHSGFSFAPAASFKNPDINDPELDPNDVAGLRAFVEEARAAAESLGGKARVMLGVSRSSVALRNTSGFDGGYDKTGFSLFTECMHDDGFGLSYLGSCRKPPSVRESGLKAAEMAADMRGARKPDNGEYTVVVEPEALLSLLETLMPSFSGDWKRRGITKLAQGAKTFSEKLAISEDGLSSGTEARPFDDEGTPSKERFMVRGGVVESFLYDRETSALEGVLDSGCCSRGGYDSSPSISPSNIVISPGECGDMAELGKYIELHYAHGSHTANPTTGDIGLEASAAFLVDKGKRAPLKGFMLTGNVFDMFSNIEAIEKKQITYGSLISPRIAFKGVRVVS